jgi:hypothetical protein
MDDQRTPAELLEEASALQELQAWVDSQLGDQRTEITRLRESVRRHSNKFEALRSVLREVVDQPLNLKVPPVPKSDRRRREHRVAALHISDTQIGALTESYDMDVCERRLMQATNTTIRLTEDLRHAYTIEECRLWLTGDLVEGETIFPTQAHQLEASLLRQAMLEGPALFVKMILRLLECFRRVKVISVPGNHGRTSKFGDPESNWDTVTAGMIQAIMLGNEDCQNTELADRLEVVVSPEWYYVDTIYDWGVLLVHGHQIKGGAYGGMPWYPAGRAAMGWAASVKQPWNYLMMGHRHIVAGATQDHWEWRANGTVQSDSEYALEKIKSVSLPAQRLYYFNEDVGLCQEHTLYLVEPGERRPVQYRFERSDESDGKV